MVNALLTNPTAEPNLTQPPAAVLNIQFTSIMSAALPLTCQYLTHGVIASHDKARSAFQVDNISAILRAQNMSKHTIVFIEHASRP